MEQTSELRRPSSICRLQTESFFPPSFSLRSFRWTGSDILKMLNYKDRNTSFFSSLFRKEMGTCIYISATDRTIIKKSLPTKSLRTESRALESSKTTAQRSKRRKTEADGAPSQCASAAAAAAAAGHSRQSPTVWCRRTGRPFAVRRSICLAARGLMAVQLRFFLCVVFVVQISGSRPRLRSPDSTLVCRPVA